jgi:hypothetical protein
MTAKKTSTTAQKVECIYRRQLQTDRKIESLLKANGALIGTNRILAGHLLRVLREKETLMRMIGHQEIQRQLAQANKFIGGR